MNTPLISIIVPVYKVEDYLDRCLQSVVGQTYDNLEIILVDDGSPDRCPEICDAWKEKDKRIKVIHKANGGLSSARNAGLDICNGVYISFVDSDDWIEPEYYNTVVHLMLQHHAEIGCVGRYNVQEATLAKYRGLCPRAEQVISSEEFLKKMLTWDECDFSACDKVFYAPLWKELRFPIGKTSEDVSAMYQIASFANRILLYPQPMYNYYHRKGSITSVNVSTKNADIVAFADEILTYIEKKYPNIVAEAVFFKIKTLLYWNRAFFLQTEYDLTDEDLFCAAQLWLRKKLVFVLFRCKNLRWKDKIWYVLIVLKQKKLVRWLVKRNI